MNNNRTIFAGFKLKTARAGFCAMELGIFAWLALASFAGAAALAQSTRPTGPNLVADGPGADGMLKVMVNRSAVVNTKAPFKRVSVAQPDIADVNPLTPSSVLITARKPGNTQLILWDDRDRSQVIDLAVQFDLQDLKEQYAKLFPGVRIEVISVNGTIALRGNVPSVQIAEQAVQIASPYAPAGTAARPTVLNMLEISGGQQVMLQVRFAELSRSAKESLGFNAFASDGTFSAGVINGPGANPIGAVAGSTAGGATLDPGVALFGGGRIGSTAFEFFIEALRQNSLVRILAEPNLVAISGQEASFLAGGEFPIPVPQTGSGGGSTITVEYREFGVKLKFIPLVLGDGKIRLKVTPEVSDLDFSTAVQFGSFVTPGLNKRSVSTVVELCEGQTFAIAGLLNSTVNASKNVTPLLGDIPILGVLFRSVRYERKETELVVMVTPKLVEPMNPSQVSALPGEFWRHPTENELFWKRDLGGELPDPRRAVAKPARPAPQFRGTYGFAPAPAPASSAPASAETN